MRTLTIGFVLLGASMAQAQVLQIRLNTDPPILQSTPLAATTVIYSDKVTPRIDAANLYKGIHFLGGGTIDLPATLRGNNIYDSILFGARDSTTVNFTGAMDADNSNDVLMTLTTGGRIFIDHAADLDLINNAYFTRQFWVYGDGTGVLELDEQFVADTTNGGTVEHGLGAIRLGQAELITHHTQSLPEYVRPNPVEGPGINGHMVFTVQDGGVWHTATNAQSYRGGVWIEQSITLQTDTDLTHTGVKNRWSDYTMHGAFQTLNPDVTVTKTGSASLILAGEQAYQAGATLDINDGRVDFQTDAVGGAIKTGAAGQFLTVDVADGAAAAFTAPLVRIERLIVADGAVVALGHGSSVQAGDSVTIGGGELDLADWGGAASEPFGTAFDLIVADSGLTGTFASVVGVDLGAGKALAVTYAADRVSASVALPGDANLDGTVNVVDLGLLAGAWNAPGDWGHGDFDGSGFVDSHDLGLLQAHWHQSTATAALEGEAAATVPEPVTSFSLALTAAQLLAGRRAPR